MSKSHGHARKGGATRTYRIWTNMKTRCGNPRASNYAWYGARGISVAPEWESFERFLSDMGEAPSGLWLDRIDSDGNYCKANCRWATVTEQQNNKRGNRLVNYRGEQMTLSTLARLSGIQVGTLWGRIDSGLTADEAADKPIRGTVACAHGSLVGCKQCKLEREAAWRRQKGIPERSPSTCPKGHLFTPETTKLNNGWRACRICAREYMRAYTARKRAIARGVEWTDPMREAVTA